MFDNIGGKIKALAKVLSVVGVILSLVTGIGLHVPGAGLWINCVFCIGGVLLSWIVGCFIYGFAQLMEDATSIRKVLQVK